MLADRRAGRSSRTSPDSGLQTSRCGSFPGVIQNLSRGVPTKQAIHREPATHPGVAGGPYAQRTLGPASDFPYGNRFRRVTVEDEGRRGLLGHQPADPRRTRTGRRWCGANGSWKRCWGRLRRSLPRYPRGEERRGPSMREAMVVLGMSCADGSVGLRPRGCGRGGRSARPETRPGPCLTEPSFSLRESS